MRRSCGNSTSDGADEKPFGGPADAAPGAATASDAQRVVAFAGERSSFLAFIGRGGEELGCGGKFLLQLSTIAAVGARKNKWPERAESQWWVRRRESGIYSSVAPTTISSREARR
jgi:hypothetical protein